MRHRLPAHRHREEPRVPHLDPGRHVRDAHGLPGAVLQRDGLLPRRREAARHHDQIPERANVIRVHDDGAQPDLLAPGVPSPPAAWSSARTTVMIFGFRERETDPRHLRADHRPADEPRVHPPRRRRAGPAARRGRTRSREFVKMLPQEPPGRTTSCSTGNPHLQGAAREDVGYLDLTGCMALGVTGPILRADRPAARPAQVAALLRLRDLRLRRRRPQTPATPTAAS